MGRLGGAVAWTKGKPISTCSNGVLGIFLVEPLGLHNARGTDSSFRVDVEHAIEQLFQLVADINVTQELPELGVRRAVVLRIERLGRGAQKCGKLLVPPRGLVRRDEFEQPEAVAAFEQTRGDKVRALSNHIIARKCGGGGGDIKTQEDKREGCK